MCRSRYANFIHVCSQCAMPCKTKRNRWREPSRVPDKRLRRLRYSWRLRQPSPIVLDFLYLNVHRSLPVTAKFRRYWSSHSEDRRDWSWFPCAISRQICSEKQRFLGLVVGRAYTLSSFFDSCDTSQHPRRRTLVAVPRLYSLNVCCVKQNRDKSGATRKKARDQIRGRTYEIYRRLKRHRRHEWIGWKRIGETFRRKLDSCEFNSTIVPYLCYGQYKHGLVSDRFDALILCRVLFFRFGVSEEWVIERLFRAQRSVFTSPEWLLFACCYTPARFFSCARQHTILALNWIQASRCSLTWRFLANQTTAPAHARGSPYCCARGDSRCQRQFTQWRFLRDVLFVREFRVSFPFLAIRSKLCFCRHFLTLPEVSRVAFMKKCVWNETEVSCLTERTRSWSDELPPRMFTHFRPLLVRPYCYCMAGKSNTRLLIRWAITGLHPWSFSGKGGEISVKVSWYLDIVISSIDIKISPLISRFSIYNTSE